MRSPCAWLAACSLVISLSGCGGGQEAPASVDAKGKVTPASATGGKGPVTASIATKPSKPLDGMEFDGGEDVEEDPVEVGEPKEGSPEWLLREMAKIRVAPPPKTDDVAKLRAARKERNEKIIELAAKAVKQTHSDPERELVFNAAVHYMLEARLQLALAGDRESVDALYDDAASLWERDKGSKSAADASFTLVSMAYANARNTAPKDLKWLQEFNRQASHFAAHFPQEEKRSVPLLFTAARSCELHGLVDDAISAYSLIAKNYPESRQAQRVSGILRRLELVGQPVELGGPGLDGSYVSLDDYPNRVVVVAFWSAAAKSFQDEVPILKEIGNRYAKNGVIVIGVCLDSDKDVVENFLKEHDITWPQIFFTEENKQGWNNPIANYYGVLDVGCWVLDRQGRAVTTTVKMADLDDQISPLLKRGASRKPSEPRR